LNEGLAGILLDEEFFQRRIKLRHEKRFVYSVFVANEPIDASMDCSLYLLGEIKLCLGFIHWLPHARRNLNVNGDVAALLRKTKTCETFIPELIERAIDAKNKSVFVNCIAVRACYVLREKPIQRDFQRAD